MEEFQDQKSKFLISCFLLSPGNQQVVIMDECHNLVRPNQVYEDSIAISLLKSIEGGNLRQHIRTSIEPSKAQSFKGSQGFLFARSSLDICGIFSYFAQSPLSSVFAEFLHDFLGFPSTLLNAEHESTRTVLAGFTGTPVSFSKRYLNFR